MNDKKTNLIANKLVHAFLNNKTIPSISTKYTKKFLMPRNLENFVKVKSRNLL